MNKSDYEPMLAASVDIENIAKYSDYRMEVKLDGYRCIAIKESNGRLELYTRGGKELTDKVPHIVQQLRSIPGAWVLDGEIGFFGQHVHPIEVQQILPPIDYSSTAKVLGSSPTVALGKHNSYILNGWSPIQYIVFDVLHWNGVDTYKQDQDARHLRVLDLPGQSNSLYDIRISNQWVNWNEDVYNKVVAEGGEGVMLKNPNAAYNPGKRRANTWYKVKKFATVDAKIIGYEPGKGKYTGQIGALVAQDSTGQEIRVSGMTDQARHDMTVWFDDAYKGKWVEIKHYGKVGADQEGYRHPQFLRMRPDLDA